MRDATLFRRGAIALLVGVLVANAGASPVLADAGTSDTEPSTVHSEHASESDITVNGLDLALTDIQITSNALPEMSIDERSYSIDERTIALNGMTMTINDTEIGFNELTITIEDSTLTVQNIGISSK
jgi:hypothetical protein